jgi:hypothetical protein
MGFEGANSFSADDDGSGTVCSPATNIHAVSMHANNIPRHIVYDPRDTTGPRQLRLLAKKYT